MQVFWQGVLTVCCGLMFVACGAAGDDSSSLQAIGGIYKTGLHLVNSDNCSDDGTNYADNPMNGAVVWHDAYFKMKEGFMENEWELEWCPDATGNGCSFSLFSVRRSSQGWYKENVQSGGQSGFDCTNSKRTQSAALLDDGHLRLEYRIFSQNVPEGSSECNLDAAKALEGNEYCGGYEVIVGSPVE
ncbi:MAG TPA: hypothetical protein EYN66_22345 [Myxococcales bacterium]|nr:hypothetical protein [Myxococcales bacterium]